MSSNRHTPRLASVLAGLMLLLASPVSGQTSSYLDFDGLTAELRALVGGSDAASLSSIGTTLEGREIWAVELGSTSGAPHAERPAVLVVGNLEGDHLVGSSHALEIVRYLVSGADGTQDVLDNQVIYVIPRLNPDGAEAMFGQVRSNRTGNARAFDDDNDGRTDENGPSDLNGDGAITVMRVSDPSGAFMIDPDEPRLMKRADAAKGESGAYTLYWEGVDSDGDGFIAEDGVGGVDLNRNFQHVYPYYGPGAGPHMISEIESRALMEFVISHRNIGAILAFGHSDNLVTPPNGRGELAGASTLDLDAFATASNDGVFDVGVFSRSGGGGGGFFGFGGGGGGFRGAQPGRDNDPNQGRRPATTVNNGDLEYYSAVSDAYREITGIEDVAVNRTAEGAFFQFGYFQFGVPSFTTQGWALPAGDSEDAPGGEGDARVLNALEAAGIDAFADWTAFDHPDLGRVEIGGFLPYATTNPPAAELADLGRAHGEFVVRLAGMLPRVSIVDTEVTAHGGGVFTVEAEIENSGYLPTSLQHGVVSRAVQPTTVQIQIDPEDVLSGGTKTMQTRQLNGSGTRERFTWVIRGNPGAQVEIRVRAQKGGSDSVNVTLR